jgi:class 3 adenylate cyclase
VVCPACGQENPGIAQFCLACGTALATAAAAREERRVVSVIFVDLVGFTNRSEALDPEDVRAILAPYHAAVRNEIESFGGIVEKFIGDAVMGIFGAPVAFGDDAERAVRAALEVQALDLNLRVAVNTGEALVTLGARPALGEAMVAGDVVNTAARLQTAAPPNGVLVGEETWLATRDAIEYEPAEAIVAKGKADLVAAWVPIRAAPVGGRRASSSTFVGRKRELAILRDVWDSVCDERTPHLVTVFAEAGTGKSRLGAEFARIVTELGGTTVVGRSLPYRESSAYGAFASQIKQLCHVFSSDPNDVALAKLRESVGTLLDPSAADQVAGHLAILIGVDPEVAVEDREALFFSVRCFIEAVARERPLMLVFEDLHWADVSLLDLVELLAARLRDLPVLLLVLSRPDLLDSRPSWGGGLPAYSAVRLGPLRAAEAEQLAAERLASFTTGAHEERAAELVRMSDGNPLFIEQLAATLAETAADGRDSLPSTIRGLLGARLDALPKDERSLLLDAAIGGKVFWRGVLERLGCERDRLTDLLGALERRDLIRRDTVSSIEGEQQFSFTHVLIRDVAYDLLPRAARRRGHEQYALFLETATADVGEAGAALARHWREAGDHARAVGFFMTAAEQAERGWAKERAVTFYREALALVTDDDHERRKAVRRRLAIAEQTLMHVPDARALGERRKES